MAEGAAAVAVAAALVGFALWWRGRGSGDGELSASQPFEGVISTMPTEPPTYTPAPLPLPSLPPSTPFPPTATPLPPVIDYSVQSGDTLFGIAIDHGVSLDDILEANEDTLDSVHSLSIGQVLRVPVGSSALASSSETVAEAPPGQEPNEPASAAEAAEVAMTVEESDPSSGEPITLREATTYTVRRGDTLGRIAVEHGVRVEELVRLNELSGPSAILSIGEEVVVEPALVATAEPAQPTAVPVQATTVIAFDEERIAALPDDETDVVGPEFQSPVELSPVEGAMVVDDTASMRWASVGRMPPGVFYVVEVGEASEDMEDFETVWIRNDSTGLRVPARFRPALGARRELAWRVTVRREGTGFGLSGRDSIISSSGVWNAFVWAPGAAIDVEPTEDTSSTQPTSEGGADSGAVSNTPTSFAP